MIIYNAVQDYQYAKEFESYLLIKQRIENECTRWLQELLETLTIVYKTGGKEEELMDVFRWAKK
jgi:hypothetical protein